MKSKPTLLVVILLCHSLVPELPGQQWVRDLEFNPVITASLDVNDQVNVEAYADGFFVYDQTHVNGSPVRGLARLDATGAIDRRFNAEIPDQNRIQDIAALADGSCWVLLRETTDTFNTAVADPSREAIVIDVPVGDSPIPVVSLIKLRTDGSRDSDDSAIEFNWGASVFPLADGGIVVQSGIRDENGVWLNQLKRITASGQLDPQFTPAVDGTWWMQGTVVTPEGAIYLQNFRPFVPPTSNSLDLPIEITPRTLRLLATGQVDPNFALPEFAESRHGLISTPTGFAMHSVDVVYQFDHTGKLVNQKRLFPLVNPALPRPPLIGLITKLNATDSGQLIVAVHYFQHEEGKEDVSYRSIITLSADGTILADTQNYFTPPTDIQLRATTSSGVSLVHQTPLPLPLPVQFESDQWPESHRRSWATLADSRIIKAELNFEERAPGRIFRLFEDTSGRVLAWGDFDFVNETARPGIARFMPDGSLDSSFNPPEASILLPLSDGGAIVRQWEPSTDPTTGGTIATQRTKRLQPDGTLDPSFSLDEVHQSPATNWLWEEATGNILVSSYVEYTTRGSQSSLVWLDPRGEEITRLPATFETPVVTAIGDVIQTIFVDVPFGQPHPSNPVGTARQLDNGTLMVGRNFDSVDGHSRSGLVRLTADGELDMGYNLPATRRYPSVILADGSAIFNDHTSSFTPSSRLLKLTPNGAIDRTFNPPYAGGAYRELKSGYLLGSYALMDADGWPDSGLPTNLVTGQGHITAGLISQSGSLWISTTGSNAQNGGSPPGLIRFSAQNVAGVIQPDQSTTITAGEPAWFHFKSGSNDPHTIKWFHDGIEIPGQTTSRLYIERTRVKVAGSYHAEITYADQTYFTNPHTLSVTANTTQLVNFSARSYVTAEHPQILGFVPSIDTNRPFLIRALGMALASVQPILLGTGLLPEPVLRLQDSNGFVVARDIGSATSETIQQLSARLGAFPIRPIGPFIPGFNYGSAMSNSLGNTPHTASVTALANEQGLSLLELYDASDDDRRSLQNFSIRARADEGDKTLTAGFVIRGEGPARILIRAVGPTLSNYHISDTAPDPTIRLFSRSSEIASNSDWKGDPEIVAAAQAAGAFEIALGSLDAALVVNLVPGVYTAQVDVGDSGAGEVLLEVYHLDP